MKQLVQKLSEGRPFVLETPEPILEPGFVLVRNRYSVISAGTEGATVRSARKSLVGKALERPKEVRAVLELFRKAGPIQTYRAVTKKLDAYSPLGYSCAGQVIAAGEGVAEFRPGDLVACAGVGYACHAEVVAVPKNLCVKLKRDADLRAAAFNTLGAIALQGVRQADLRLGETCAVIGLGLVGTLAALLLKASGARVFGLDVDPAAVERARALGVGDVWSVGEPALEENILLQTRGLGADAVVVAASSTSLDPINLAGRLARKKGKVVLLGDVPTGFDRNPDYYPKELELRMSRSYGPGRYDPEYEENGRDYPPEYVRWTEKRNMEAFQDLVYSGAVDAGALVSRVFSLDDAPKAYDMILERKEPFLGLLVDYGPAPTGETPSPKRAESAEPAKREPADRLGIAFIGAGSYAQGTLIPNLPTDLNVRRVGVATRSGATARRVANKFGFDVAASDARELIRRDDVNAVFIATRHDSHARYALEALDARQNVFLEKPLCLTLEEFTALKSAYEKAAADPNPPRLCLGFNRRFAPLALELKKRLSGFAPMSIVYRVDAGAIPKENWIQNPEIGGGRILGEVCHFVDFCAWLANSAPVSVYAAALDSGAGIQDTVAVTLKFANGSLANVCYFANGSTKPSKERIEVFQSRQTAVLENFSSLQICGSENYRAKAFQNKGQAEMLSAFLDSIRRGLPSPIPAEEIFQNTLATFAILESLASGREIPLV